MLFFIKYLAMSLFNLFRSFSAECTKGTRVLMYHSIDFGHSKTGDLYSLKWALFEQHLKLMQKEGVLFYKISDNWGAETNNIVLSFDDGFADNFEMAKRLHVYNIPVTIFVVADFIDTPNYLSSEQLQQLLGFSNVEVGCHGKTHRPLTELTPGEWMEELKSSKEKVERILGVPVTSMSFPHGRYSPEMISFAEIIGFKKIATSDSGLNYNEKQVRINRTAVFKYDYNWVMKQKICGLWDNLTSTNKTARAL